MVTIPTKGKCTTPTTVYLGKHTGGGTGGGAWALHFFGGAGPQLLNFA